MAFAHGSRLPTGGVGRPARVGRWVKARQARLTARQRVAVRQPSWTVSEPPFAVVDALHLPRQSVPGHAVVLSEHRRAPCRPIQQGRDDLTETVVPGVRGGVLECCRRLDVGAVVVVDERLLVLKLRVLDDRGTWFVVILPAPRARGDPHGGRASHQVRSSAEDDLRPASDVRQPTECTDPGERRRAKESRSGSSTSVIDGCASRRDIRPRSGRRARTCLRTVTRQRSRARHTRSEPRQGDGVCTDVALQVHLPGVPPSSRAGADRSGRHH